MDFLQGTGITSLLVHHLRELLCQCLESRSLPAFPFIKVKVNSLGVLLGLLVKYVNGCTTFWGGFLTAYALWNVVNWFDAIVLDCLWFCHDPHFVIKGTEDMTKDYHDYWFHIKGSLIGMVLAIPSALIAGLIVIL